MPLHYLRELTTKPEHFPAHSKIFEDTVHKNNYFESKIK